MAGVLHIERRGPDGEREAITLDEWKRAVAGTEGVRLASGDAVAIDPVTGKAVTMPNRGGDAEAWREDCAAWLRVFWWSPQGTIGFRAPEQAHDPRADPTLALARALSARLAGGIYESDGSQRG